LYRKVIAASSEICKKLANALIGQNAECIKVKPGGTYCNR
jgi:hypothetical protein